MKPEVLASLLVATTAAFVSADDVAFVRHTINAHSEFSACAAIDVNQDGKLDIVSGGFWYEAPTWRRHGLRDVQMIRGRYDDYSNLPLDVNGDGRLDLVSANYRSSSIYWVQNPGTTEGEWKKHVIDAPGSSETGRLADVDGDGDLDILPNGTKFAAWYDVDRAASSTESVVFRKHDLPAQLIGHGLGCGDINGDGRADLVCPKGWLEAPLDRVKERWMWHPEFRLHRDSGIPILVFDVDQDGDNDLVWGRGHDIGLYWLEQRREEGNRTWEFHAIDTSWSECHSLMLADINRDGCRDVVVGKRYLGHDGKDPGEYDPLAIYWYEFNPRRRTWDRHVVSYGANCGFDLDPKCVDIDADGDIDILAAARSGLFLLENRWPEMVESPRADPELVAQTSRLPLMQYSELGEAKPIQGPFDWGIRRAAILSSIQRVMGVLPSSSERVPLAVELLSEEKLPKYTKRKITFRADRADRVPAFLLIPNELTSPAPAVLCLHSTRPTGKASICGEIPQLAYADELAQRGYVCLAPDYPSLGEYDYDFEADQYASGSMKAIWNNIRAIDLLESLPEVDRDKIGSIGHSLGGHNSLFTAVFDQRLRVVVTSCGFNAFEDYYGGDLSGWSGPRYMPRIRDLYGNDPQRMPFDFDEILAALAPRGVFVSAPKRDDNFPVQGVEKAVESARRIYQFRKAGDRLFVTYPAAGHRFPKEVRQQAYDWIKRNL